MPTIAAPISRFALLSGALMIAAAVTAGCSFLPKEEEEAPPPLAAPVKTEKATYKVARGQITDKVTLRAMLAPVKVASLYYKAGGRLKAVYVQSGDAVRQGQILAELHADDAAYQLAQAEIRLEKARLALEDGRFRSQFKGETSLERETRRLELDVASATLEVERYRAQVADSRLVAPFSGQITSVTGKPGDNVQGYMALISLSDPSTLWVEADVDSGSLSKLSVGQKARLEFSDAPGLKEGTVVELPDPLARATAPAGQPQRMKVSYTQSDPKATIGLTGKVHVILQEKKDVLLLPNAAIRKFANRSYVLLSEPRREVDVAVGIEGETESEITKGLKEGDVVIGR